MKTIRITVPKVHCVKKNDFLNKDRVYLVLLVTAATTKKTPEIIFSGISGVSGKFKKNSIKALNLGTRWAFEVPDDAVFNITFGLYEYDKGDVYQKYQEKITEIADTKGMNYMEVIQELWKAIKNAVGSLDLKKLILALPEVGLKLLQNLRQDDLLGRRSYSYKANDPNIKYNREFDLTDAGSHYKIQIALEGVE